MDKEWSEDLLEDEEFLERLELIKIKSIATNGERISLTWDELNDSVMPYKRSLKNGKGITPELIALHRTLDEFIKGYLSIKVEKDEICFIVIRKITFKEKSGAIYVKIAATMVVNLSREIGINLPEIPLYDFDREDKHNRSVKSFPRQETEYLKQLELEAKYYIEGKRGPAVRTLFEEGDK